MRLGVEGARAVRGAGAAGAATPSTSSGVACSGARARRAAGRLESAAGARGGALLTVARSKAVDVGCFGTKAGMTTYFEGEDALPVTVIGFDEGNVVTMIKTQEKDGYDSACPPTSCSLAHSLAPSLTHSLTRSLAHGLGTTRCSSGTA